jgi:hypothetical protein
VAGGSAGITIRCTQPVKTLILAAVVAASSATVPSFLIGALPDRQRTPGDVLQVTVQDICTPGYTKVARNVPTAIKRQVYFEYGRQRQPGACCEVDHLVPLELGGSNRLANLWTEPYDIKWNARVKDRLEGKLHRMVCSGDISLPDAQRAIALNWIEAYRRYISPEPSRATNPRRQR